MGKSVRLLSSQFGTVPVDEAIDIVREQLTFYRDVVRSYVPHTPLKKLAPDLEAKQEDGEQRTKQNGLSPNFEQNQADAKRKAITRIKDYAKWNQFELFATFTFKADRQNTDKCFKKITNWFKNENKKQTSKIEFLIVPEYHKDEQSLHFHALIKNYTGKVSPAISPKTGKQIQYKGKLFYEFPSYRSGFTNVKMIGNTPADHAKVGIYISKYLAKDIATFIGRQRYRVSKGLEPPPKQDNPPPDWNKDLELIWSHTNEYGTTSYYKPPKEVGELNGKD